MNFFFIAKVHAVSRQFHFALGIIVAFIDEEYLRESNMTNTVVDLLMNNSNKITWKYYDHPIQIGGYQRAISTGQAFEYWNPFSAKGE